MESNQPKSKKFLFIFIIMLILGISYGTYKYLHSQGHEITDDAQVEKNMNPIIPKVSGYITKVYVTDNQMVKKGDTLFTIDNSDFLVKIEDNLSLSILHISRSDVPKTIFMCQSSWFMSFGTKSTGLLK